MLFTQKMNLNDFKIILASQSPRRSQLLRELGFEHFVTRPMDVDETPPPQYPTEKLGEYLAEKKAEAARPLLGVDGNIILAADTTVVLKGKLYEKPLDFEDARRILRDLSGNMHEVITGVCLLSATRKKVFSDVSKVYFDSLTDAEIDFYVEKCTFRQGGGVWRAGMVGALQNPKNCGVIFQHYGFADEESFS